MAALIFAVAAKDELREAAAYYDGCQKGLGKAFLAAIEAATRHVASNPLRYRKIGGRFRRCLVERFPYGLIYAVDGEEIFVAAVMHLKRKPGYWEGRVRR